MRRREFIALIGSTAASWPPIARAQQSERVRRIGVLMGYPENDLEGPAFYAAFREGLEQLGWVEGRNIRFAGRRPRVLRLFAHGSASPFSSSVKW